MNKMMVHKKRKKNAGIVEKEGITCPTCSSPCVLIIGSFDDEYTIRCSTCGVVSEVIKKEV